MLQAGPLMPPQRPPGADTDTTETRSWCGGTGGDARGPDPTGHHRRDFEQVLQAPATGELLVSVLIDR